MYCHKCGKLLKDDVNFCDSCGTKVAVTKTTNNTQNQNSKYEFYEKFGPDSVKKALNVVKSAFWLPSLLSSADKAYYEKGVRGGEIIVKSFAITDKSIIFKEKEYPSDVLSVIYPISKTEMKVSVSGKEISLFIEKADFLRLYNAVVRLNEKNRLVSTRQKLLYAYVLTVFLKEAYSVIHTLPVAFGNEDVFEELPKYSKAVIVNEGVYITDENKQMIQSYKYTQNKLNEFYKKTKLFSGGYDFCKRVDNLEIVINNISESDNDLDRIIKKLCEGVDTNSLSAVDDDNGYFNDKHDVIGKHMITAAFGVGVASAIAGKISGRGDFESPAQDNSKKSQDKLKKCYFCPTSCPTGKNANSYGKHKCPLDPSTCGHGRSY